MQVVPERHTRLLCRSIYSAGRAAERSLSDKRQWRRDRARRDSNVYKIIINSLLDLLRGSTCAKKVAHCTEKYLKH